MRRIGSGTRGLRRKATLQTRLLALLRSDDCKATTLWFADVPEPAGLEEMAAATMRALRDGRTNSFLAGVIELRNCALQSVELGRDGVKGHNLRSSIRERRRGVVEAVDRGRTMLHRWRVTSGNGGPRDARAAQMLPLKENNSVEVGVDQVENRVLVVELLRLEQVQENAAVEGEFGHEHLCASRKRQGWSGVLESLCRPGQVNRQTVPVGAESLVRDLEGFETRERREGDTLKQLLLLLLSGTPKEMCVECRLKFVLIETDPGRAELIAVLPSEAGSLHDAADDGGVK
jgi:hypothetical protein